MKFFYIIIFCFTSSFVEAQSLLQKADTAFANQDYHIALDLYQKYLKKEPKPDRRIYYQIAECYRFENKYNEAIHWYESAIEKAFTYPDLYYNYGEMLVLSGNYLGASTAFEEYLRKRSGNKKAKFKIASCEYAIAHQNKPLAYAVKNEKEINSNTSDYGLALFKEKIIFASTRQELTESKFDAYTGQGFSDFYEARYDNKAENWIKPIKLKGGANTKFNDGSLVYDEKNNVAYFMQCNATGKSENCNIFFSEWIAKDNTWSGTKILGYNNSQYSTGHPALSVDGKTMYFVSDMPGGIGGKDLWKIQWTGDNKWSDPVNLGSQINTEFNEMFPYVLNDTLFFASDGHLGYGGLDIFSAVIKKDFYSMPVNLHKPINSSADDFSIIFKNEHSGLFCSNREGGVGDDDIYSFKLAPLILSALGTILDSKNEKPVSGVTVTMTGNDGSILTTQTDSKGNYLFIDLKPNVKYTVGIAKKGYFGDSKTLATGNEKYSKEYSKKSGYDLDFGIIKLTREEIEIPNIYYEFNKWELNSECKKELDKLINILKETPDVSVVINSHTDEKGSDEYNLTLSQKRAQTVVEYVVAGGIETKRLSAKGYGESQPLKKNAQTDEEHSKNRRTTFKITSK